MPADLQALATLRKFAAAVQAVQVTNRVMTEGRMNSPASKAQALGAQIRAIRKASGVSMKHVADRLDWSEAKVSRLETGQRPATSEEVSALLAILNVTGDRHQRLLAMARTPHEPAWLEALPGLSNESISLISYEAEAQKVTDWAPLLVPGLLQTMEYGRHVLLALGMDEAAIGTRLMARQRRQQILEKVEYTAYIDEAVLRRPVGSPLVMSHQLQQLLDLSRRSNVTIRVVPVNSDAHAGLICPFIVMESAAAPTVVSVEILRSAVFLGAEGETHPYLHALTQLSSRSMDGEESRMSIEAAKEVIDRMKDDGQWRKATLSGDNNCVAVKGTHDAIRDTKNPGVVLHLDPGAFAAFLADIKAGAADMP